MREVTIEGTENPAAGVLARGKRATVAYTARIARLISYGYVRIVAGPTPVEEDEVVQPPVETPADSEGAEAPANGEQDGGPDPEPGDPQTETTTPPKAPRSRGART